MAVNGEIPLPVSGTTAMPWFVLTVNVPVLGPPSVGVNTKFTMHSAPVNDGKTQLLVWLKSPLTQTAFTSSGCGMLPKIVTGRLTLLVCTG